MRTVYKTPEDFKAALKVGDFVTAWATGKAVQITAMGEKDRFLAVDVFGEERVNTMTSHTGWEKIDQPDYWEAEEL